jgi:hypothetical protein
MTMGPPRPVPIPDGHEYIDAPSEGIYDEEFTDGSEYHATDDTLSSDDEESGGSIVASNTTHDRLSSLRIACSQSGYPSLLAAALDDAKIQALRDGSAPRANMRLARDHLDELCRVYNGLGVFRGCPKTIDRGLGQGACALSLPILMHEFDKLRSLDVLNHPPAIGSKEFHAAFDMADIFQSLTSVSPHFLAIITSLLNASDDTLEYKRLVVTIVAILANARNSHSNYMQKVIALYLFASKTPKRVIQSLNHLGISVSYTTLLRDLKQAAKEARKRLRALGITGLAFIPVFDNLTFMAKVAQERVDNKAGFMTFTSGYILIPPLSRTVPMFDRKTDIIEANIRSLTVKIFLPTKEDHLNIGLAYTAIIGQSIKAFAKHEGRKIAKVVCELPEVFRIDPKETPEILPLPTYDLNEARCSDMINILYSIQKDTGLSDEQSMGGLTLHAGDLMTVEGMRYDLRFAKYLIVDTRNFDNRNVALLANSSTLTPPWECFIYWSPRSHYLCGHILGSLMPPVHSLFGSIIFRGIGESCGTLQTPPISKTSTPV